MTTLRLHVMSGAFLAAALATAPSGAQAQANDPRWDAWIGCWQLSSDGSGVLLSNGPLVCVSPTASASAVELATVEQGRVVARDTIDASGARRSSVAPGCTIARSAEWSQDSRRVYQRSETSCGNAPVRVSSGVLAMTREGEWLDVRSLRTGASAAARTLRYREVTHPYASLPEEFFRVATGNTDARHGARALAASNVSPADVIETASKVDTIAVQAWLVERQQRFDLDARTMIALADAGVPATVTDVMVAVSYPQQFRFEWRGADPEVSRDSPVNPVDRRDVAMRYPDHGYYAYDYYGYNRYSYSYSYFYGHNYYGRGYGYDPYYSPYGGGGYYTPVVVTRQPELPHGRVVKGRGYTADSDWPGGGSAGSSASAGSTGRASATASSGSSSSGSSSSGRSSGSSGSSTGRSAQRKGGGQE